MRFSVAFAEELRRHTAAVLRSRAAYAAEQAARPVNTKRPCAGCETPTRALSGLCPTCQKEPR